MYDFHTNLREGIDLCVYHCGMEECEPGHSYGPAVRDHFLIHYILDGQGRFHIDGKVYNLHKNQGFLICPDIVTYYEADREDPWTYTWVGFQGVKAEMYLRYAGLTRENPVFTYDKGDYIRECFSKMIDASKLKKGGEIRLQGLLYLFLSELIEAADGYVEAGEKQQEVYIRKAIQYIEMNYSRDISVMELAKHIGLDRSYLCSLFKEYLKVSPREYLIRYRMDKACELMKNPSLSISDVARSVGYNDPLGFSKMFKKVKGCSPKEYRRGY